MLVNGQGVVCRVMATMGPFDARIVSEAFWNADCVVSLVTSIFPYT